MGCQPLVQVVIQAGIFNKIAVLKTVQENIGQILILTHVIDVIQLVQNVWVLLLVNAYRARTAIFTINRIIRVMVPASVLLNQFKYLMIIHVQCVFKLLIGAQLVLIYRPVHLVIFQDFYMLINVY